MRIPSAWYWPAVCAGKVEDHDARATLYGELLSTCAGCHQLVRQNPVPGP